MKSPVVHTVYNLAILALGAGIRVAAAFHPKAREWRRGRKQVDADLAAFRVKAAGKKIVWVHCASLGEFEQGRPVIESLAAQYPDSAILLTFFSPSGYRLRKDYPVVTLVCYLPLDAPKQVCRFLDQVRPDLVIFIKYEFWFNYLYQLSERRVPTLLVSAVFHQNQPFFGVFGFFFRQILPWFEQIFVQNQESACLLETLGARNYQIGGDTRVDRVAQIAAQAEPIPVIEQFAAGQPVLVIGSSWPEDEKLLQFLIRENLPEPWKVIIAPHEIGESRMRNVEKTLAIPAIRYSSALQNGTAGIRVLLIDNIGMLSRLYRYGRVAYIGGGFGAGIHNTLEPMAFGLPVIIGPRYRKFGEAVEMVQKGGIFAVKTREELVAAFNHLQDEFVYEKARQAAHAFIDAHKGGAGAITSYIQQRELL